MKSKVLTFGLLMPFLALQSMASTIMVGSDGAGPVQLLATDGTLNGTFGANDGTAAALDASGGLFVATPGDTSSTINVYDPSQTLLSSFLFTAPGDARPEAAFITDLTWGDAGTLWATTFSGEAYHLAADGTVLSSFDTGTSEPGIAFDGTSLYTTSGPGFLMASPFIYQRDTSGNITNTINTGLNDTLGLAFDSSTGTFFGGGFDTLSQVDAQGALLNMLAIPGTHLGVDAGDLGPVGPPPPPPPSVPEPSTWILLLTGLVVLAAWRSRWLLRTAYLWVLCLVSLPLMQAAPSISSLTPNPGAPQPVGTSVTFTASASDTDAGALRYRFRVRPAGGVFAMVRDYSPANSVAWTPIDTEGSYEIEVSVLNRTTRNTAALSTFYTVSARAANSVSPTNHPLVGLYTGAPCPAGSSMRVRFKLPADVLWQSTPLKACNGSTTMNFLIAGMRASSQYQLRDDVITGPHVVSGPIVNFTTGAIGVTLPEVDAIIPLKPPSSMTEGVTVFDSLPQLGFRLFAVDAALKPIWYSITNEVNMTRPVPGGGYLVTYGFTPDLANSGLRQFDLAGHLVKETNVERMNDELAAKGMNPVTVFHHEIRKLANGDYLLLAMTERALSVQGPPNDIAGDMILVLDDNLQLLWAWDDFAPGHLDVNRPAVLGETCGIGAGQCVLLNGTQAHDWTHGNSVALAPDGNIIYSARHQDFVYKIAYQNGAGDGHIIWKLGKGGDFTYVGTNDSYPWFSHQHDAEYEDATTLSVFDNGNTRITLLGTANAGGNSRGQALHLDEANRTVSFILNQNLGGFSFALGSATRLLNGDYVFGNGIIAGGANTENSEWTTSGTEVSNIHSNSVNYRTFRLRDLYSSPF